MTLPATIGRYRVVGELGRGAMGVVYRGVDPSLDRPVAIKVIASRMGASVVSSQELEARFLREARVAARISHPGVVTVYDAGREGDSLYLVMELIDGESLGDRLSRGEYPSTAEALVLVARVAEALGVAHALGVIHRDIKPANIMLTRDGGVKVADFGVAKAVGEETNLTRTGIVVGSPAYMAPEQVRGQELDGRADLFSLGVMLYELLLRRKPFPSETVTTLIYQILHEDPLAAEEPSRRLDEQVRDFLRRCLAKEPKDRLPDGQTMATEARMLAARLSGGVPGGVTAPVVAPRREADSVVTPPAGSSRTPVVAPTTVPQPAASRSTIATPSGHGQPAAGVVTTSPTVVVSKAVASPPSPPVHTPPPGRPSPAVGGVPRKPRRVAEIVIAVVGMALLVVAGLVALGGRRQADAPPPVAKASPRVGLPSPTEVQASAAPTPAGWAEVAPSPSPRVETVVQAQWPTAGVPASPPGWAGSQETPTAGSPPPATVIQIQWPTAAQAPPSSPAAVPHVQEPPVPPAATPPPIAAVFECQKAVKFGVSPDKAEVTIDGKPLGIADDWDGFGGGPYEFPRPGKYTVKLSLDGYQTVWVQILVKPDAEDEEVTVDTELEKVKTASGKKDEKKKDEKKEDKKKEDKKKEDKKKEDK